MRRDPTVSLPASPPAEAATETRFVNAIRLTWRQWLAAAAVVAAVLLAVPSVWSKVERFRTGRDYRIPYSLSKDYWLYERRLREVPASDIFVIGDSVVWGEYVNREGTLSHFLTEESGGKATFVNVGVNGMFPLALEGLVRYYGETLHDRRVLLHCNLLWMTSPKADLQTEKEERFNHADLVPQFSPRIPCYKADLNRRLAAVVERNFTFSQWAKHLQMAYFDQKNLFSWTLEEDPADPTKLPNAYKNPFAQITLSVPSEPQSDPDRGPSSPRHKPWSTSGQGSTRFDWVPLERSLQWAAFQRLVLLLRARHDEVFVVLGPFNEHIMAQENRAAYEALRNGAVRWFEDAHVPYAAPPALPSNLYADASHPLTAGYELLARELVDTANFQKWSNR